MLSWILRGLGLALVVYWLFGTANQPETARNIIFGAGIVLYLSGSLYYKFQKKKNDVLD